MFQTKRLLLRGVDEEADLNTFMKWQNDAGWLIPMTFGPLVPTSRAATRDFIRTRPPGSLPFFAVCEKPELEDKDTRNSDLDDDSKNDYNKSLAPAVGVLNFATHNFDYKNRNALIGLGFADPQHRGIGYGTELLEWAMEYAFMELGLHRVTLEVFSFNEAAIRLYQKVGFTQEGRQRKTYFKSGVWHDTILMGILEEDWVDLRKNRTTAKPRS